MDFISFAANILKGWIAFTHRASVSDDSAKRTVRKLRMDATLEMLCCSMHHATQGEVLTLANPPVIARSYTQGGDYYRAQILFDLADKIERERLAGRPVPVWLPE